MSTIDINTATDISGASYTQSVSNDKLTNEDFLKLMIQELKMQDPTKPMDSKEMLDMQMKMSSLNSNMELVNTLNQLKESSSFNSLSNSTQLINKIVKLNDGNEYYVNSIQKTDEDIFFKGSLLIGIDENNNYILDTSIATKNILDIEEISA